MVAVHDGTANINRNNVINVKCSECKYGEWEWQDYGIPGIYHCILFNDWLDEKVAECDELGCDGFEYDDRYDDTAA